MHQISDDTLIASGAYRQQSARRPTHECFSGGGTVSLGNGWRTNQIQQGAQDQSHSERNRGTQNVAHTHQSVCPAKCLQFIPVEEGFTHFLNHKSCGARDRSR
ncbi:hypothetical protein AGR9A_Lc40515 [Agrobacterium salinitolerans str. Hayward 0363]|nr:hypothetical protein AGR9A_Lc40515 [Agrobacterium salinitolerans str. Hayward 0363]